MLEIVLSIAIIFGLAGGPTDFGDTCTVDQGQTVSQGAN